VSTVVWTDSHCHLHDESIPGGTDAAVDAARAAGVTTMITVGCDRTTTLAAIAVAQRHVGVHATAGLHPHEARFGAETIADLVEDPAVVAVGEAGLDYHYDHSPRDDQRRAFAAQIQLARAHRLPLVIHTREAWDDTFDVLAGEGVPDRTVFHCFTGGPDELRRCLDVGAFVSFSGIASFPSAADVRAAAAMCPAERLLVETDSPYLAPVPHRGRRNQPAWVPDVGGALATLRGCSTTDIAEVTSANARLAFPALGS
jgi:TatD DNase family protein